MSRCQQGFPTLIRVTPTCEQKIPVLKENVRIWCKTERTKDSVRLLPVISLIMTSQRVRQLAFGPMSC